MPSSPQLTRHTGVISGLAFSPDGTTLATGSWDHSIQLWDFTLRTHITTLRGQSNEVWSVAFSPGQSIAGGGKDGSLKLWPARQPDATNTIPGHWQPLAINGDGKQLASVNREGTVGFFDLKSLKQTRSITLPNKDAKKDSTHRHSRSSQAVAISADLKTLVQGLRDGSVAILDTESRERTSLSVSTSRPSFVALSPDAHYLVAGGRRQPLTVWDLHKSNSTEPIATIDGERALFSQTGETMIIFSERGKEVEVWDATSMTFRDKFVISPRPGYGVALTPDGGILATTANIGDFNNAVSLWDTSSGELLGECIGHKQGVWSIAFAPDGKSLASSSDDGTLKFWNVATQQEMLSIRQVGTTLTHLTFSPDGQWLVSSKDPFSTSGELQMLRAPSFGEIEMWLSPDKN